MSSHIRTGFRLAAVLLAGLIATTVVPPIPARGQPVVIDFEDLDGLGGPGQTSRRVTDQYTSQGVVFSGATALDYSEAFPTPMPDFPRSGSNAVEACYAEEFCSTPVAMVFRQPQGRVQVWVGYSASLEEPIRVRLRALDAAGDVVGEDDAILGPSDDFVAVRSPLAVSADDNVIATAEVGFDDAFNNRLAVDDVEFEVLSAEAALSAEEVDFGEVEAGSADSRQVDVISAGSAPLAVRSVTVEGSDGFAVTDDGCSGTTLPPQDSCAVTVDFSPRPGGVGPRTGQLVVVSNAPSSPHRVALRGVGVGASQPTPTPATPSPDTTGGGGTTGSGGDDETDVTPWLLAGAAAGLVAAGARAVRRRGRRWVRRHVRVRAGPAAATRVTVARDDPGADRAVGVRPRSGPPTHTIEEKTR